MSLLILLFGKSNNKYGLSKISSYFILLISQEKFSNKKDIFDFNLSEISIFKKLFSKLYDSFLENKKGYSLIKRLSMSKRRDLNFKLYFIN